MKRETIRKIAALIYPNRCPVCGEVIGANDCFCAKCSDILIKYTGDFRIEGSSRFVAAYEYRAEMSEAVMIMKRGTMGNAPYAFGTELAARIRSAGMDKADLLIPVPMYRTDLRRRGANQAHLIAQELGRHLGIPVNGTAVIKSEETLPQKELKRHERIVNMHGAFTVRLPQEVAGKRIIVVDDVCTTGSTLAELTSALLASGAAEVCCAAACKVPDMEKDEPTEEM